MKIESYSDILKAREGDSRQILLGNGFSIACRADIFPYKRLFEKACTQPEFKSVSSYFDAIKTENFELVMRRLRDALPIIEITPGITEEEKQKIRDSISALKELLIKTIAERHPEKPGDISEAKYTACRKFLGSYNQVFTLNYDLLLYWTIMNEGGPKALLSGKYPGANDGFRDDGTESRFVYWEPTSEAPKGSNVEIKCPRIGG